MGDRYDRARRELTSDELKAADAAFQGRKFNEAWSDAALRVYIGIVLAKMKLNDERLIRGIGNGADDYPLGTAEPHPEVLV